MVIKINNIGLAAYIRINSCQLIGYEDGKFLIESDKPIIEWKIEYDNNICSRRDQAIHSLRSYYGTDTFLPDVNGVCWTQNLGLASYVYAMGIPIVGFDNDKKRFYFKSTKDFSEWQIDYINSECSSHDAEVNRLRDIAKTHSR